MWRAGKGCPLFETWPAFVHAEKSTLALLQWRLAGRREAGAGGQADLGGTCLPGHSQPACAKLAKQLPASFLLSTTWHV